MDTPTPGFPGGATVGRLQLFVGSSHNGDPVYLSHRQIIYSVLIQQITRKHNHMDEFKTVALKKISAGSIYKIYLLGLLCSLVPIGILNGILGAIGITLFAVRWNGEVVHGFSTLIISPCLFALLALVFTGVLGSLSWAGLWFYSQFRPLIVRLSLIGPEQ